MLEFNAETHTYTYQGLVVPGVTTVIETAGLSDLKYVKPDRLEYLRNRGTAVHLACEYYDKGILDELPESISGYVQSWKTFLSHFPFKFEAIEERVFHKENFFAGTVDRIGTLDNKKWVIDIKTGYYADSYPIQTAAYRLAYEPNTRKKINRGCVLLQENGEFNPKRDFKIHNNKKDIDVFLAALEIHNYKNRRKS